LSQEKKAERCADAPRFGSLATDLARLALAGTTIYSDLSGAIGREELDAVIVPPGAVQIALRAGARFVIPAAVIYDYPWASDDYVPGSADFQICEEFSRALCADAPLEESKCFKGECPTRIKAQALLDSPDGLISELGPVICPSGFWGFRHALGFPVSNRPAHAEGAPAPGVDNDGFVSAIYFKNKPELALGISTDPMLAAYQQHAANLQALGWGNEWKPADSRNAVIRMLKNNTAQIIYLYCHGGKTMSRNPILDVGYKDRWLSVRTLSDNKITFRDPHPLVFINGCETVSVEQEVVLNFVSEFTYEHAAGVIGTEITVSDTFASDFAEQVLRRFAVNKDYLGDAVRGARLNLLQTHLNPLGLIYTPFALESLRLVQKS
jgi:hypothetical protein